MDRRTIVSTLMIALALLLAPTTTPPALAAGDGGAKQLIYKTSDGHIHELSITVGGSWQHADLTQLTGAPPTLGMAFGCGWESGGSKQVVYIAGDGHIHELYAKIGGSWQHADLTQLTGAPPSLSVPSAYAWETGGSKQVVYTTQDGHIHELSITVGGSWQHADLTQLTGAPPTSSWPSGYGWEGGRSKQVVYNSQDEHIHELYMTAGGSWQHADLTQLTGAPGGRGPQGNAWEAGGSKQVVYQTADRHIHELYAKIGGSWQHADLTQLTGAPLVAEESGLQSYAWEAGGSKQVVYQTGDNHFHELSVTVGGSWQHADLTQLTGAPLPNNWLKATYASEAVGSKQVLYKTEDGHIHELYAKIGGSWQHADLTQLTGAPLPATGFYPFGYAWEPNLLQNGNFELDANSDTQPDNWTSDSHFTRSSTTKHSGSFAGRHYATDGASYTIHSQIITNLHGGEPYNVLGWVKIPPYIDDFSFQIRVRWFSGNFPIATDTVAFYQQSTGSAWELVSANKVAPGATTSAWVEMVVTNLNSSIYVDDFVFGP